MSGTVNDLLGQAALLTARGKIDDAIEVLKEVIKLEPKKAETYLQLSDIYEERSDLPRAYEYRRLYCELEKRPSASNWENLAEMALELERAMDASDCYAQASKLDPRNWVYYEKRIKVLDSLGLEAIMMKTRLQATQLVDMNTCKLNYDWLDSQIREVAEYYVDREDEDRALTALAIFIQRRKEFGQPFEDQHETLLSRYFEKENWSGAAMSILGIVDGIEGFDEEDNLAFEVTKDYSVKPFPPTTLCRFKVGQNFPISMLIRLIICFIRIEQHKLFNLLIEQLHLRGELPDHVLSYIDICKTFADTCNFEDGLKFVECFASFTHLQSEADFLFFTGYFHEQFGHLDTALEFYNKAIELRIDHVDARVNISAILQSRDDMDGALDVLKAYDLDGCRRLPDDKLLIKQIELLRQQGNTDQYIRSLRMLLGCHFYDIITRPEKLVLLARRTNFGTRVVFRKLIWSVISKTPLAKLVRRLGEVSFQTNRQQAVLSSTEIYDYVLKLADALFRADRTLELLHVLGFAVLHPDLSLQHRTKLKQCLMMAAAKTDHYKLIFEYLRDYNVSLLRAIDVDNEDEAHIELSRQMFLTFNYVASHSQTIAMQRYVSRLLCKHTDCVELRIIAANASLMSGSYKQALNDYLIVYNTRPTDPLINLLLGVCFTGIASQSGTTKRPDIANRAAVFMGRYARYRAATAPMQEIYYNIGRFLHQLGFFTQAVNFYQKVLDEPDFNVFYEDENTGDLLPQPKQMYDMKPLAALNYADILKNSNPLLARTIRRKYCVI